MKKVLLCILDGWGFSAKQDNNAIFLAKTPFFDFLYKNYPYSLIEASGNIVGLPQGQMGNSEVGHLTIGAGRTVRQDLLKIHHLFQNKNFFDKNNALNDVVKNSQSNRCHILGLLSDGGVHSHISHIIKLAEFLKNKGIEVLLHIFTDGRDTNVDVALNYIKQIQDLGIKIASISGRYYAMDRDNRWNRTALAYEAIMNAQAPIFQSLQEYVSKSYDEQIFDEFIMPAVAENYEGIKSGDSIIFANFRADRIRQLAEAIFGNTEFHQKIKFSSKNILTKYSEKLASVANVVITPTKITNHLGHILSQSNIKQLRVAETEKYPHITYFLNCGEETSFALEERVLISSPKVSTYDQLPAMSAHQITETVIKKHIEQEYQFTCINYANADMVGHTGDLNATIKACETVDECISKLAPFCESKDIDIIITADHGNAEEMMDDKQQVKTSHTLNKVPLIYYAKNKNNVKLLDGNLTDIAPTILSLLNISKPEEMTGNTLIKF